MTNLKPANENPWYVLMTLHGEHEGVVDKNGQMHLGNSSTWNNWATNSYQKHTRAALIEQGFTVESGYEPEENEQSVQALHLVEMKRRNGDDFEYPGFPDRSVPCDFSGVHFVNEVKLTNMIFPRGACFKFATFSRHADFSDTEFGGAADFQSATFTEAPRFIGATFHGSNNFGEAKFKQGVLFVGATWNKDASFSRATFTKFTSFTGSTFTQKVTFNATMFSGSANFKGVKVGDPNNPKFALLELTDAQFDKPASFRNAKFLNRYPEFSGAIIHEKTLFPTDGEAWPKAETLLVDEQRSDPWDNAETRPTSLFRDSANSCAFLRHHVRGQGLPEAEYLFFQREMDNLSKIGGWWERLPYKIYGWSDYGTSIAKPALWLGGLWLFFSLSYVIAFNWPDWVDPQIVPAGKGWGFSVANMFKFLGFQRTYYGDLTEALPNLLKFMAALQTTTSYVLIFFLGLGLRARFRLR